MYYAVQVEVGQEFLICEKLKRKLLDEVIHTARKKLVIKTNGERGIDFEEVLKGYIIVGVKELTPRLWHVIKETGGVYRILGKVHPDEMSRIKESVYPVIELREKTIIPNRKERILRKASAKVITEKVKNCRRIVSIPVEFFGESIAHLESIIMEGIKRNVSLVRWLMKYID